MSEVDDLTTTCIRCGFCLESCPTFRLSGRETESPRGRIYLVRQAARGQLDWRSAVQPDLDTCLGCRACEPACPSGVRYGRILEEARAKLQEARSDRALRRLLNIVTSPARFEKLLRLSAWLSGARPPSWLTKALLGVESSNRPSPQPPTSFPSLQDGIPPAAKGTVVLLRGCAQSVLDPSLEVAAARLLRRVGFEVHTSTNDCCGALDMHLGFKEHAKRHLQTTLSLAPQDAPIVTTSAGCGSYLKEHAQPRRVYDLSEFLVENGLESRLRELRPLSMTTAYQAACHLEFAQGVRSQPLQLLSSIPGLSVSALANPDCCGSAGIFSSRHPEIARKLALSKWDAIRATRATIVISANPGCQAWLSATRPDDVTASIIHIAVFLEQVMSGILEQNVNKPGASAVVQ